VCRQWLLCTCWVVIMIQKAVGSCQYMAAVRMGSLPPCILHRVAQASAAPLWVDATFSPHAAMYWICHTITRIVW
jgi:hypothetical protein